MDSKFTLIIDKPAVTTTFDLVIGPADIELVKYYRRAEGDYRMRPLLLNGQAIDVHIAEAEVTLPPVEIGPPSAFGTDLKRGTGKTRLYPLKIGGKATETKPGVTAVGHMYLHWLTVGGRDQQAHDEIIESLSETAVGRVVLYPLVIGAWARNKHPNTPSDDPEPEVIRLYSCAMTGRDLIRRFRELSQDEVEPYLWNNSFVLNCLNEAELEAADRAKLLFDDTTPAIVDIAVTAGKARYEHSQKILDIERAFFQSNGKQPPILLHQMDRHDLDWRDRSHWRGRGSLPYGFVHDGDRTVQLAPVPRMNGILHLEVHRMPLTVFGLDEEPEIPCIHHLMLVDWALYRAFSIPDADEANERLAAYYLDSFEKYFGRRVNAKKRRDQRMNKPHVNKLW